MLRPFAETCATEPGHALLVEILIAGDHYLVNVGIVSQLHVAVFVARTCLDDGCLLAHAHKTVFHVCLRGGNVDGEVAVDVGNGI